MSQPAAGTDGLDVIGVGFGRTGTKSLKVALECLGLGPCYHMWEVIYRPDRAREWHRIARGETADWAKVYAGYRSTVDWPGAAYWRELVDAYPDAKVILTVRDPGRWYDSACKTIFQFPLRRHGLVQRLGFVLLARLSPDVSSVPEMLDAALWDRVFGGRAFDGAAGDREYAIRTMLKHEADVRAYVPPERLLVFNVAEGWDPLCKFLGVPVPTEPFPQSNETQEFIDMLANRRRAATRSVVTVSLQAVLAVGLGILGARALRDRAVRD